MIYSNSQFAQDCLILVDKTKNKSNFNWNVGEVSVKDDLLLNSLSLSYLKASIVKSVSQDCNFLIDFNVIYSEVYQMPTVYFLIHDLEQGRLVNFDEYLQITKLNNSGLDFFNKNYEVSKTNHPFNGMIYNFLYLCKFNLLLTEICSENENIFFLWLSMIMQIFGLETEIEIFKI